MDRYWKYWVCLVEVSQTQKDTEYYFKISLHEVLRIGKFTDTRSTREVTKDGVGKGNLLFQKYGAFVGNDEKILSIDSGKIYTTLWTGFNDRELSTSEGLKW